MKAILILTCAVALTSCNTFIGMGRDIRMLGRSMDNVGEGMEDTAYGRKTVTGKPIEPSQPATEPAGPAQSR